MAVKSGLENLIAAAKQEADQRLAEIFDDVTGESEIERLLVTAIMYRGWAGTHEQVAVLLGDRPLPEPARHLVLSTFVKQQVPIGKWRADIVCYTWDHEAKVLKKPGWRKLVVECDGHNFHERTKEQAARDRARDRAMTLDDYTVMRFTGSEIWKDAWGCAGQIYDWSLRSF